ncbi:hypothetical protein DFP73DRAFT_588470 [Morchella snyderi]|nr:hypothetical protein DFP73DRAFT_588470 [Morchella snyderi]
MVPTHGWDWNTTSGPPCAWDTGTTKAAEKYHHTIAWLETLSRSGTTLGATELEAPQRIAELEAAAANLTLTLAPAPPPAQTFEIIGTAAACSDAPAAAAVDLGGWDEPMAPEAAPVDVDMLMWSGVKTFTVPVLAECPGPEEQQREEERLHGQGQGQGQGRSNGGYKGRKNGGGYRGRGWRGGWGGGRGGRGGGGGGGGYNGGRGHEQGYNYYHYDSNIPTAPPPPPPPQQQHQPWPAHKSRPANNAGREEQQQDPEPTWGDPNAKWGSPKNTRYRW